MELKNQRIRENEIGFKKLIAFLKGESVMNVAELFFKNLNLLKKSNQPKIASKQNCPSLKEISLLYCSKIAYKYFFFISKISFIIF